MINSLDYKESSKILKIFTRSYGILSVVARGAKRPKSKMQNLTSVYCLGDFKLKRAGDMFYLQDGHIEDLNEGLRRDLKDIYFAQVITRYVQRGLFENQVNENIFDLYVKTLSFVVACDKKLRLLNMFLIKYIAFQGYLPRVNACLICGSKALEDKVFSIEDGGLVCKRHGHPGQGLDKDEVFYLNFILYSVLEKYEDLKVSVDELEILDLLAAYIFDKLQIKEAKAIENFIKTAN